MIPRGIFFFLLQNPNTVSVRYLVLLKLYLLVEPYTTSPNLLPCKSHSGKCGFSLVIDDQALESVAYVITYYIYIYIYINYLYKFALYIL